MKKVLKYSSITLFILAILLSDSASDVILFTICYICLLLSGVTLLAYLKVTHGNLWEYIKKSVKEF